MIFIIYHIFINLYKNRVDTKSKQINCNYFLPNIRILNNISIPSLFRFQIHGQIKAPILFGVRIQFLKNTYWCTDLFLFFQFVIKIYKILL